MIVNGEQQDLEAPTSVADLVESRGLDGARFAVEINGQIVPRNPRSSTR